MNRFGNIAPDEQTVAVDAAQKIHRERMVREQTVARGIHDAAVIYAMRSVPRHLFVPEVLAARAYNDKALAIGHGQTIAQPYTVALMSELLEAKKGMRVLEIGTGSGYQAAILGAMGLEVYTVERLRELYRKASNLFTRLLLPSIRMKLGDGTFGWPESGPYDRIIVTAASPEIPESLIEQLADPGIMVIPTGMGRTAQRLVQVRKQGGRVSIIDKASCGSSPYMPGEDEEEDEVPSFVSKLSSFGELVWDKTKSLSKEENDEKNSAPALSGAQIKVIGVGGGGGKAVNTMMIAPGLQGAAFIIADTDAKALAEARTEHAIQLGTACRKKLSAESDPGKGCKAGMESLDQIKAAIGKADIVFVVAGMGGGTGTGATSVIAQAAKELGILTVGVVTKPFFFEGKKRLETAERGIAQLREHVDNLMIIPNDRLLQLAPKETSFAETMNRADEVLFSAVKGLSDLFAGHGLSSLGEKGAAMADAILDDIMQYHLSK